MTGKQVLDVLRDAGRDAAPFAEAFPDLDAVGSRLLFAQQKVELVHVVPGRLALGAVLCYTSPDLVLNDQHAKLFQLFTQFLNVITDQAVLHIHVRPVIEHVQ